MMRRRGMVVAFLSLLGCGGGDSGGPAADATGAPPTASIYHPGDGETRAAGVPVPFTGAASDAEDGTLSGAALVWASDIDGQIGTGESFEAALAAGVHVITLTATDSDGNVAKDAITLTME